MLVNPQTAPQNNPDITPAFVGAGVPLRSATSRGPFHKSLPATLEAIRTNLPNGTPIELWWQDEARVGQKNKIARRWARRGTRPRAPHDQRTSSVSIFGAICPQEGK